LKAADIICGFFYVKAAQGCAEKSSRNFRRKLLPLTEKAAQGCAEKTSRNYQR
jgi:hypothetical protein